MSLDRCIKCDAIIDTDLDCNFYDFNYIAPNGIGGHCENCRDDIYENMTPTEQAIHEERTYG